MGRVLLAALLLVQDGELSELKTRFEAEKPKPSAQRLPTLSAVGALRSDPAAAFLGDVFDKDSDPEVRAHALKTLAVADLPSARQKLAAVARDAKALFAHRAAALDALTGAVAREGFEAARALLKDSSEIRLRAWVGLRRYPLPQTEALWRTGLDDPDPFVRGLSYLCLAPLKEIPLQERAKKSLLDPADEPLAKYGAVAVLKAADGIANARVLIAAAATPDTTLRRLLADALGANTDEKAPEAIYQALRHADASVRLVAARALGGLKDAKAMDRLAEPLKDKVPDVRAAALEAVAQRKEKSSETILHREAQRSDEDLAGPAIALLTAFPTDATRALLAKLAGNYKPGIAIPALEALGEIAAPDALPVLDKALKSKDWPVRVTAIRGLGRLKSKEAVDLLMDRLDKEDGRVLGELVDALRALTGRPFGFAPGQWREWWSREREAFTGPKAAEGVEAGVGATTYHGVPILSTRLVFCVDISGSMSETLGTETRMELAKKELIRTLGSLNKDAQVNLIFFDDRLEPWHQKLTGLKSTLKEAVAIVSRLQPRGRTNIFDALDLAFQHKEADTVFLLSDGDPSDGRIIDPDDILAEIRRMNRVRKIMVHTIAFAPSPFMKALAEQNGGRYVEIK
ncbi:MAG TPA: HEAT repeat domain-containing protein [Planctomycetota bacterium]